MATSTVTASFPCGIERVWEVVTSLENTAWRSDLSRVEVVGPDRFIEYTKDGYATNFEVTCCEVGRRWEFDMENDNMRGHWTGVFSTKNGQTQIVFTEEVSAKKALLKPFVTLYLKKQQAAYIADLKKALAL